MLLTDKAQKPDKMYFDAFLEPGGLFTLEGCALSRPWHLGLEGCTRLRKSPGPRRSVALQTCQVRGPNAFQNEMFAFHILFVAEMRLIH